MKNFIKFIFFTSLIFLVKNNFAQSVKLIMPEDFSKMQKTSELYFEWHSVDTAIYYQFEISRGFFFEEDDIVAKYDRIDTNVVVNDLENHRSYFWRVRVAGGEWSDVWSLTTTAKPVRPTLITPENEQLNIDTNATFTWSKNSINQAYRIELSPSGNFSYSVKRETVIDTTVTIGGLSHNTKYYWRVSGENVDQEVSGWSYIHNFTTVLNDPEEISPIDSARYVPLNTSLAWTQVPGADKYQIMFSDDSTFNTIILDKTTDEPTISIPKLEYGSVYYWKIKSFGDLNKESRWSNTFHFNTNPGLIINPEGLIDTINFSIEPKVQLKPVYLENLGETTIAFDSVVVKGDSALFINISNLEIPSFSSDSVVTYIDTSKIDTSLVTGSLNFYSYLSETETDSFAVEITLLLNKAIAKISLDTLKFDSTFATSTSIERFYLSNKGNYELAIKNIKAGGLDSSSFKILDYPKTIAPFDSSVIVVQFKPDSLGIHYDSIAVITNSYPDTLVSIALAASGYGPSFSKETLERLDQLSKTEFETFTNNFLPLGIYNNGTTDFQLTIGTNDGYFELYNELKNNFKISPNSSDTVVLKYLTPNFDYLNIDTLKILHNSFGKSPIAIPLRGSHNETYSSELLQKNIKINNSPFTNSDYIFPEQTAIQFFLDPRVLEDFENLNFRVKYYIGGPGNSNIAPSGGDNKYVIPYQNVKHNGLLFTAELVAFDSYYKTYDSTTVFDYLNGQVVVEKYTTPSITVPYSQSSTNVNNVNPRWVFFGFPKSDVIADTVFSYFGGQEMMKDGEWIIYEYTEEGFKKFNSFYFEPNKGYIVAQGLTSEFEIEYQYENDILSRKLTDSLFTVEGSGWRAISSPYTFDVEVDSSTILYTYDTNNKTYRLTSIMRPGFAYFVDDGVTEIKLKTYGNYYPDLFPKIVSNSEFAVKATVTAEELKQEIIVGNTVDYIETNFLAKAAPIINDGFNVYLLDELNEKSLMSLSNNVEGNSWDLVIQSKNKSAEFNIEFETLLNKSTNYSYLIYDNKNSKSYNGKKVHGKINKGEQKNYQLLIGTEKYIKQELKKLQNGIIEKFRLGNNFPNPFNPTTTINFDIPSSENNSFVNLSVYNMLGQLVDVLVNERKSSGNYEVIFDAANYTSGVYFYRLKAGKFVETKKMTLIK